MPINPFKPHFAYLATIWYSDGYQEAVMFGEHDLEQFKRNHESDTYKVYLVKNGKPLTKVVASNKTEEKNQ